MNWILPVYGETHMQLINLDNFVESTSLPDELYTSPRSNGDIL